LFFSATIDDNVLKNIGLFVEKYKTFTIKKEALKLKGVKQFKIMVDDKQRKQFLQEFYTRILRSYAMIFVNRKNTATYLQEHLKSLGIQAQILISGLEFSERDSIIDGFRGEKFPALISTNVLARGIDIPQVDIVINFDIP
jgi:ATP-dependent RNA helicase DDX19/DBP5